PEHPSDTKVFTMKLEILLEPTSNKLLLGTLPMLQPHSSEVKFIKSRFQCQITVGEIISPKNSQVKLKGQIKVEDDEEEEKEEEEMVRLEFVWIEV
nr:hypothetical protein [Tanacetum cinerariifolium]